MRRVSWLPDAQTVSPFFFVELMRSRLLTLAVLTLFPRRDLGRDGDMRMVALRRSVHRGEW